MVKTPETWPLAPLKMRPKEFFLTNKNGAEPSDEAVVALEDTGESFSRPCRRGGKT